MKQVSLYLTLLLILICLSSCQPDQPFVENDSNLSDITTDVTVSVEGDEPASDEDPTDDSTEAPTEELTEEPSEESTDELTEEPTDEPTEKPTDQPEEPTDEPGEETTEESPLISVEPRPDEFIVYASDLEWLFATCHSSQSGPAADQAFDRNGALVVDGVTYEKGIGTHGCDAGQADGEVVMSIPATATRFRALVGLDDRMSPDTGNGTVAFVILLDGVEVAHSGILYATSPAYVFDVDVSGYSEITLRLTNGGDSAAYDAADWCWAYFVVTELPEETTKDPSEDPTEEPSEETPEEPAPIPVEPRPDEVIVYASDLEWISATCHGSQLGPAVDQAFDRNGVLTVDGVTYEKGFGTHGCDAGQPDGEIVMNIPATTTRFRALVGLDDRMSPDTGNGTVEFVILLDGVEVARSGILYATSPAYVFDVDVSGATVITLRLTNGGDSAAYDGADWCWAYFVVTELPEDTTEEPSEDTTEEPADDPIEPKPEETIVYASDLVWISATCHGSQPAPAVDQAFDRNGALVVDGVTYEKGFGTHGCDAGQPDGEIVMSIPENALRFHAVVGLDDRMCPDGGNGTVEFVILLDGVVAARSGILTATSPAYVFDVDVSGATVITLRLTNGGDSAAYDGADWCDAYFTFAVIA